MKLDTAILFLIAFGLIAGSIVSELQHRQIKSLQTQIDELRIVVDQKFLPAVMLDKTIFGVR
jgi:hypothetical protein